jgi:hypothetical protein
LRFRLRSVALGFRAWPGALGFRLRSVALGFRAWSGALGLCARSVALSFRPRSVALRLRPRLLARLHDRSVRTTPGKLLFRPASLPALPAVRARARFRPLLRLIRPPLLSIRPLLRLRALGSAWRNLWARVAAALAHIGHRDGTTAAQVDATDPATSIVIHRTLPLAGHEAIVANATAVLEDETRLGPERTGEDHSPAAVVPIGVVVGVIVDHDPEPHTGVRVRVPVAIAGIAVAVITEEPRVVVTPLHIVGDDVVVPVGVAVRNDALCQVGERDVGVAPHAAVGDHAIVPMVAGRNGVVFEWIGGDDGEHITDAG